MADKLLYQLSGNSLFPESFDRIRVLYPIRIPAKHYTLPPYQNNQDVLFHTPPD